MSLAPWSDHRAKVDGTEFERIVAELLQEAGRGLPDFRVEQQEVIRTHDGQYRIDITLRFTQVGVHFVVLVECKDHARPVEREDVQILADKKRAAGAHKAILFSTNGFQRGAIDYARSHGIALVRLLEGALTYETRALHQGGVRPAPPPWANIPPFVAQHVYLADNGAIHVSVGRRVRQARIRCTLSVLGLTSRLIGPAGTELGQSSAPAPAAQRRAVRPRH